MCATLTPHPQPAVPDGWIPTSAQIDAAVKAWFENEIVSGRQPFEKRMRAAITAALAAAPQVEQKQP